MNKLARIVLPLTLVLTACGGGGGGGGGGGTTSPTSTQSPAGIWFGSAHSTTTSTTTPLVGVVTADNKVYFSTFAGNMFIGSAAVNGNGASGTMNGYALNTKSVATNGADYDIWSNYAAPVNVQGTFGSQSSFTGTYSGMGDSGTFSLSFDSRYNRPSSLAAISANWTYTDTNGYTLSVSIDAQGSITGGGSSGCTINGTASLIDPAHNAYDANITVSNCGAQNGTYTGVAALSDTVTANDTLEVIVTTPGLANMVELTRS